MEGIETNKLTPNMKKHFNNIFAIKMMVKNKIEESPNDKTTPFLREVLEKLQSTYKPQEEIK